MNPTYGGRLVSLIVEENKSLSSQVLRLESRNETLTETVRGM